MYSPPMRNVWLPPHPSFVTLKEPLAWGRLMRRSVAVPPPRTVFAPTSAMRGSRLLGVNGVAAR